MSLVGVYPNPNLMTKEQLIDYLTFIEAQAITKECDLRDRIKYLETTLRKSLNRLAEELGKK